MQPQGEAAKKAEKNLVVLPSTQVGVSGLLLELFVGVAGCVGAAAAVPCVGGRVSRPVWKRQQQGSRTGSGGSGGTG